MRRREASHDESREKDRDGSSRTDWRFLQEHKTPLENPLRVLFMTITIVLITAGCLWWVLSPHGPAHARSGHSAFAGDHEEGLVIPEKKEMEMEAIFKTVEAEAFILRDNLGNRRAEIAMTVDDNVEINLFDAKARSHVKIRAGDAGVSISLVGVVESDNLRLDISEEHGSRVVVQSSANSTSGIVADASGSAVILQDETICSIQPGAVPAEVGPQPEIVSVLPCPLEKMEDRLKASPISGA